MLRVFDSNVKISLTGYEEGGFIEFQFGLDLWRGQESYKLLSKLVTKYTLARRLNLLKFQVN